MSAVLAAIMVIARVPQFLTNLYGYAFNTYFFEFSPERPASFDGNSVAIISIYYLKDPRGLFSFVIAFGTLATAACTARDPCAGLQ